MTAPVVVPLVREVGVDPAVARMAQVLAGRQAELDKYDRYYTGDQPLRFMAPEIAAQLGDRLTPLVINWPQVIVDSVARRVQRQGFALGKGAQADDELERIWQANDMDEESQLGQVDALVHHAVFLAVWANEEDAETPLIGFESAHQMTVEYGSDGRTVARALKVWRDEESDCRTLYLPNLVLRYRAEKSLTGLPAGAWRLDNRLDNPMGAVPIVPLVNRGRTLNRVGQSELKAVMPIADAINKLATDMMVTSEFHASPRRYATDIALPSGNGAPGDLERIQAEARAYWDEATKGKTWLAGKDVKFGQFPEAQMTGFVAALNMLTAALAAIGGLPPDDLGLNTTNPASAEARRAAETTLVMRADEKKRAWSGSYERTMRLAVAAKLGVPLREIPAEYRSMETKWADSATPAVAQTFDAAVKGVTSEILDLEQAREFVGLSPVQRAAITARAQTAATEGVRAQVALANELEVSQGISKNAALAAVGLLQAASMNSAESA